MVVRSHSWSATVLNTMLVSTTVPRRRNPEGRSMEELLVALAVVGLMVWRVAYFLRLGLRRDSGPY